MGSEKYGPETRRKAQELREKKGIQWDEISAKLGIPSTTIKTWSKKEKWNAPPVHEITFPDSPLDPIKKNILNVTKNKPQTDILDLLRAADCTYQELEEAVNELHGEGYDIELHHKNRVDRTLVPPTGLESHLYSRVKEAKPIKIGILGDNQLGNQHARLDVLQAAYDHFEAEGITNVYHTGNLIDGFKKRFNFNELLPEAGFTLDSQCAYAANVYPKKKGMTTHFITGECHEGWWYKDFGLNVGRSMQHRFKEAGRDDLVYVGHLEADIEIRPEYLKPSCRGVMLRLLHPGGGSSYAYSYKSQKISECVPMSSEILTRDGWKEASDLREGELVMGYNQLLRRCEWTHLVKINRPGRHPVEHWRNDNFEIRCTPEHRWAMEWESRGGPNPDSVFPVQYSRREERLWTFGEAKDRSRIIQAAPGPEGSGWEPIHHGHLLDRRDTVATVLAMTSAQRWAFIHGMMEGEGTRIEKSGTLIFSQALGPVQDAFVLACFLQGIATSVHEFRDGRKSGYKPSARTTLLKSPKRMVNSMRLIDESIEEVWCPTTELGTWVMRQGGVVTITGNSLQGGEKPHIQLIGHFHKFCWDYHREVHNVQTATTCDQTPFMRKHYIAAHVGYLIADLRIHPTGILETFKVEYSPWYDRAFYKKWIRE